MNSQGYIPQGLKKRTPLSSSAKSQDKPTIHNLRGIPIEVPVHVSIHVPIHQASQMTVHVVVR